MDDETLKDCKVIQEEFAKRGYNITLDEASYIWEDHSQRKYCSRWEPVFINHHVFKDLMDLDETKEILKSKR